MKYQILTKLIQYFSEQLYQITDTAFVPSEKLKTSKVLILARHHYIEKELLLPITLKKDVKAAIAFETELVQEDFIVLSKIVMSEAGKTKVMLWQIPKKIIPKGFIQVIPETFLLSHAMLKDEILTYRALENSAECFVVKKSKGFSSVINSPQPIDIYAQAQGVGTKEIHSLKSEHIPLRLFSTYLNAFMDTLSGFWLLTQKEKQSILGYVKPFVVPFVVFFSCYLAISSFIVSMQFNRIEAQIKEQKSEISKVLKIQSEIGRLEDEIEKYNHIGETKPPLWKIWRVLGPLYRQGIIFKFIRYNGKQVFINVEADSATSVLEYFIDVEGAEEASFTTAIRKIKNKDSFTLKFTLSDEKELEHE